MGKLSIIIPAAGLGRRMRSYGPKALIKVADGETVIQRMIRVLRTRFPGSEIIVVAGHEAERIRRVVGKDAKIVLNHDYETTNVAHSLRLGFSCVRQSSPVLLVYGDLVFTDKVFEPLDTTQSSVIIDARSNVRQDEVGVNLLVESESRLQIAACFSYGLPLKWAQIALLREREVSLCRQIVSEPFRGKQFGFEILNEIIERGGSFVAHTLEKIQLVEIDCSSHIAQACQIK